METTEKRETGIRISSSAYDIDGGRVTFSGIPRDSMESVEGMANGHCWMTVRDGKPVFAPTRESLPNPIEDSEMFPFWRRRGEPKQVQEIMFEDGADSSVSFMVKYLCGHYYTPENYQKNARLLESYGFACMRSQRGQDGKFWETWYLPGVWAARGELKEAIEQEAEKGKKASFREEAQEETRRVVAFLGSHVSFGSLDVVTQRLAMLPPG